MGYTIWLMIYKKKKFDTSDMAIIADMSMFKMEALGMRISGEAGSSISYLVDSKHLIFEDLVVSFAPEADPKAEKASQLSSIKRGNKVTIGIDLERKKVIKFVINGINILELKFKDILRLSPAQLFDFDFEISSIRFDNERLDTSRENLFRSNTNVPLRVEGTATFDIKAGSLLQWLDLYYKDIGGKYSMPPREMVFKTENLPFSLSFMRIMFKGLKRSDYDQGIDLVDIATHFESFSEAEKNFVCGGDCDFEQFKEKIWVSGPDLARDLFYLVFADRLGDNLDYPLYRENDNKLFGLGYYDFYIENIFLKKQESGLIGLTLGDMYFQRVKNPPEGSMLAAIPKRINIKPDSKISIDAKGKFNFPDVLVADIEGEFRSNFKFKKNDFGYVKTTQSDVVHISFKDRAIKINGIEYFGNQEATHYLLKGDLQINFDPFGIDASNFRLPSFNKIQDIKKFVGYDVVFDFLHLNRESKRIEMKATITVELKNLPKINGLPYSIDIPIGYGKEPFSFPLSFLADGPRLDAVEAVLNLIRTRQNNEAEFALGPGYPEIENQLASAGFYMSSCRNESYNRKPFCYLMSILVTTPRTLIEAKTLANIGPYELRISDIRLHIDPRNGPYYGKLTFEEAGLYKIKGSDSKGSLLPDKILLNGVEFNPSLNGLTFRGASANIDLSGFEMGLPFGLGKLEGKAGSSIKTYI